MTTLISTLADGKAGFFALLTQRMNEKGDFPALSKSVQHLEELMRDEEKNITNIANAILSDFTLTQKVIRLANSETYSKIGGSSGITTISHAAVALGLHAISNIVLNIQLIDTLSTSTPDSDEGHEELRKVILAGDIARNIVAKSTIKNGEEAVVCALMHHVGRLMLVFHFPEEWLKIQKIARGEYARENAATLEVVGVTIDEISHEIAQNWRLPEKISNSMASSATLDKTSIPGSADWLKIMANFCGNVSSMLARNIGKKELKDCVAHYSRSLLISSDDILESIELAQSKADKRSVASENDHAPDKSDYFRKRLTLGLVELSFALARKIDFSSALSIVLETIYVSMGFNRVITFFHDAAEYKVGSYIGSLVPEILPKLIFPEAYTADVFHLSLANRSDVFIQSVASTRQSSIPDWFRAALPDAGAFILLPMVFDDKTIGLIYADWRGGENNMIDPDEFVSLGMLRDQLMRSLEK